MRGMRRLLELALTRSRSVIAIPIAVLIVAAVAAFVYGAAAFIKGVTEVAGQPFPIGNRIGIFLLVIDLFLIGATLLIAAIGFYELFFERVGGDGGGRMPRWLQMDDLNDLKARVLSMIVLIVAVSFVEAVVDEVPGVEVLELGGGIGIVVVALTAFIRYGERPRREG